MGSGSAGGAKLTATSQSWPHPAHLARLPTHTPPRPPQAGALNPFLRPLPQALTPLPPT